jgi:hypothetical protein
MKLVAIASGLVLGASMLFASSAFANSAKLDLFENVRMDGQNLKPGHYTVEWNGTGNNVHLQIKQDGKVLASAPAIIRTGNPEESTGYTTNTKKDGTVALKEIFFGGKHWTLEIQAPESSAATAKSAT